MEILMINNYFSYKLKLYKENEALWYGLLLYKYDEYLFFLGGKL